MQEIVSVIIPVYNGEQTIKRAITSVLAQTYRHFEMIIVDDHSTDQTATIVSRLAKNDPRIKYYRNEKNKGVAETRNFGYSKASGEYIAFLDSDDEWKPRKLELQLLYIEETQSDLCFTAYEMIDRSKSKVCKIDIPTKIDYRSLLKENVICCSTVLLKSKWLEESCFRADYFHEDFILWLELLKNGIKAVGLEECLVRYSQGGRSADKLNAMKYRWLIYRRCESLGVISSIYYFLYYGVNGIKKYYFKRSHIQDMQKEKESSYMGKGEIIEDEDNEKMGEKII